MLRPIPIWAYGKVAQIGGAFGVRRLGAALVVFPGFARWQDKSHYGSVSMDVRAMERTTKAAPSDTAGKLPYASAAFG